MSGLKNEIVRVANDKTAVEVGGGHNQKGIEFQRYWAVMRMLQLLQDGAQDFLLLFETFQDIAELDSCSSPSRARIYQVKKREGKTWRWAELTNLGAPKKESGGANTSAKPANFDRIRTSPIGKLYLSVISLSSIECDGRFVSNAACELPLADETTSISHRCCCLSQLEKAYAEALIHGLATLHSNGDQPDPARLSLERVELPANDPSTYVTGIAHTILVDMSPEHAGQARSLVQALVARISPLGARTDRYSTFDELRRDRGFSRAELDTALTELQSLPDALRLSEDWLEQLTAEGLGLMDKTSIRSHMAAIRRRQLRGGPSETDRLLAGDCDEWLASNPLTGKLLPYLESACSSLSDRHRDCKKGEIWACLILRAVRRCADQSFDS